MRKRILFAEFLVAAALIFEGKLSAQDAQAADAPTPPVTVANFMRDFADQTANGKISVNTVDLLIVDAKLAPGVTGEVMFGTDWGALKSGLWPTQNARFEGAHVKKDFEKLLGFQKFFIQGGTIDLWGPPSGDQPAGTKNNLVNGGFFDFGGAYGGLMGLRAGGKLDLGTVSVLLDAMAATGDRGLTGSVAGVNYPSFCQGGTHEACGFVGGVNADVKLKQLPGFTGTAQFTRVGNTDGLSNELRSTAAARYEHKAGPVVVSGALEGTHATHYLGGKPDLNVEVGTVGVGRDLSKNFGLKGYVSQTRTQDAIREHFTITGTTLSYHKGHDKLMVDVHNEPFRSAHVGTTVSWFHAFN